jgi:hypothetical protein
MTSSSKWITIASALGLLACSPSVGPDGQSRQAVRVRTAGCSAEAGVNMTVSVRCESGYETERRLAPSESDPGVFEGLLDGVPAGMSCEFHAEAVEHRAGVDVHYSASLTRRFERGEQSPLLVLVLQQDDGVTSFGNAAPRILGLTASRSDVDMLGPFLLTEVRALLEVNADAIVLLNAGLYDPNGDPIWYRWDDAGLDGTFIDLDSATMQNSYWSNYNSDLWMTVQGPLPTTMWIPPLGLTGTAYLTITVKDEHAGSGPDAQTVQSRSSLSVKVDVDEANIVPVGSEGGTGSPPVVLDMLVGLDPNSTGGRIFPGETAQVLATLQDVDSLALSYNFVSSCPGAFFDALGNSLSDPLVPELAPLGEGGQTTLFASFIPAVVPSTGTTCDLVLYADDGEHRVRALRQVEVVASNPTLLGPDITLARATPETIGRDSEVLLEVAGQSRNTDPSMSPNLLYKIDILTWLPIPEEYLPEDYFGTFIGEKENHTGRFAWRSAADPTACMQGNSLNNGSTFYFIVSVVDASLQYDENSVSPGSPATNRVVIPVHVDCTR